MIKIELDLDRNLAIVRRVSDPPDDSPRLGNLDRVDAWLDNWFSVMDHNTINYRY